MLHTDTCALEPCDVVTTYSDFPINAKEEIGFTKKIDQMRNILYRDRKNDKGV